MKNKKMLITSSIICIVMFIIFIFFSIFISKGYGISIGVYYKTQNEKPILIKNESSIQMSNKNSKEMFKNFDIGDKILVVHTGVEESYPARTRVNFVFKIGDGTISDVPKKVINELINLGWM